MRGGVSTRQVSELRTRACGARATIRATSLLLAHRDRRRHGVGRVGVQPAPHHERQHEAEQGDGSEQRGRAVPAELLRPQAERQRAGELPEIARLLEQSDLPLS